MSDQAAYESRLGAIREALEPESLAAAWKENARMSVAEIVVYAQVAT